MLIHCIANRVKAAKWIEEGILSPYLVLLTNVLIYIMYKSLEDRST